MLYSVNEPATEQDLISCFRLMLARVPADAERMAWLQRIVAEGLTPPDVGDIVRNSDEYRRRLNRIKRPVQLELEGSTVFVSPDDAEIGKHVLRVREYEPHVARAIKSVLREGQVFVDVGANAGYHTLLAARIVGEAGKVIAIEANPCNTRLLRAAVRANRMEGRVISFDLAATSEQCLLELLAGASNGEVQVLTPGDSESELVQGLALDTILAPFGRVDVIKTDTEGHELSVLQGAMDTLRNFRPVILFEFHPYLLERKGVPPESILNLLTELQYKIAIIPREGPVGDPLGHEQIMEEWRKINAEQEMEGKLHMDLIAT
ncbi:MAG TPA: FkbM family methyltransferase [Blastocatellia bacterium]|nr:FkbM family methyltransferase [Blastocatellia bacterium]